MANGSTTLSAAADRVVALADRFSGWDMAEMVRWKGT